MDISFLARVDAWLAEHRAEIIKDLSLLVNIPSISQPESQIIPFGQPCRDVLEYMFTLAQRHGYKTHNYENYVGAIEFQHGEKNVGFWAHLDVVPVPDPTAWKYPPFEATVVEQRYMIGRGVQDNKAPAMGVFHVMNCLRDLGIQLHHGYTLYLGTNEECGMADARYFASHYPCPDLSIVPDSGFPVCCAQRGAMTLRLSLPFAERVKLHMSNNPSVTPEEIEAELPNGETLCVQGQSAHVYNAEGKRNAILELLYILAERFPNQADELQSLAAVCAAADGQALGIHCSDAFSGGLMMAPTRMEVTDECLYVDVFVILPVTSDGDALVKNAQKTCCSLGITASLQRIRKPCSFPQQHPVVQLLTHTYNEVMHENSQPFAMSGGNYASCLPNAFGFGPGMPGREFPTHIFPQGHGDYHQCDESQDLEQLWNFMRIYAAGIVALDQVETLGNVPE